jgi:Lrp/AsnC family leucine-responsive transcriptional regulator
MDEIDRKILRQLMRDGRATWADLAVDLGLTAPAIAQRVRRLQDRGIIRQFVALVAPGAMLPISAFVGVSVGSPAEHAKFRREVLELDQVQECHQLSGDDDYVLKVRCASLGELADLVSVVLPQMAGGGRVRARVVLSTVKESAVLPLPDVFEDAKGGLEIHDADASPDERTPPAGHAGRHLGRRGAAAAEPV